MKEADKDKQLADLHKQIEELQRKAEVASQQAQGEVQEIELESILAQQFRFDKIEPVPKGVRGADIIQRVYDETGRFVEVSSGNQKEPRTGRTTGYKNSRTINER